MEQYSKLAELFCYPEKASLKKALADINSILYASYPQLSNSLDEFAAFAESHSTDSMREYFIKTFDIQASCYLDIGYVLFGEDYKRGTFLVHMIEEHKKAQNDCGVELPDHLPNILRLLPKIKDKKLAEELAYSLVLPALREMQKNFLDEVNVYKKLLQLLTSIIEVDFKDSQYKQFSILSKDKTNFLNSINCGPKT